MSNNDPSHHQPPQLLSYETPPGHAAAASGAYYWDGKCLIVPHEYMLPHRCIHCGASAANEQFKKLVWMNPMWFLLVLVGWLPLLIAYLIVRKTGWVQFFRCDACHAAWKRRKLLTSLAAAVFLAGSIGGLIYASLHRTNTSIGLTIATVRCVCLIVAGVLAAVFVRGVSAQKIDAFYIHLRGISPNFVRGDPAVMAPAPYPQS